MTMLIIIESGPSMDVSAMQAVVDFTKQHRAFNNEAELIEFLAEPKGIAVACQRGSSAVLQQRAVAARVPFVVLQMNDCQTVQDIVRLARI